MGIINRLRNKANNNSNINNNRNIEASDMLIFAKRQDGTDLALSSVKIQPIPYTDGTYTKIITGKVSIGDRKNLLNISEGNPICIEVPYDMQVDENLVSYFDQIGLFNNLQSENYNILGRLTNDGQNWSMQQISQDLVNGYIYNLNNEYIIEQENRKIRKDESARLVHEHALENLNRTEKKDNNIKPYFRKSPSYIAQDGYSESNYKMKDLVMGDEINIEHVRKLGKDEFGTYLYSAYINKDFGKAGLLNEPDDLYPVLFSTVQKLDEISALQDPEMIERISRLFSGRSLTKDNMTYLGELNSNGVETDIFKVSNTIRNSVSKLQTQYREQIEAQRQGGWR